MYTSQYWLLSTFTGRAPALTCLFMVAKGFRTPPGGGRGGGGGDGVEEGRGEGGCATARAALRGSRILAGVHPPVCLCVQIDD